MKRTSTAKWHEKYNRWQINVQKDGERRAFYSSAPGRTGQREANAKADAWLDDDIENGNRTVSEIWQNFYEEKQLTTSKSNWKKIDSEGRTWIMPAIGNIKLEALGERHLQKVINNAHAKGLAKKTLCNLRATMYSFVKYCRIHKATMLLPEAVYIPRGAPTSAKHILQPEAIQTLLCEDTTVLYGQRVRDEYINAYRLQVLTGMRPGELLGLEWGDIFNGAIHIQRAKNSMREITTGKNENAIRSIALTGIAKQVIDAQSLYTGDAVMIFPFSGLTTYAKRWKRYCASNDIEYVTLYELRHTFVSIAKQLPEGVVKRVVGHSRNMDTFGVYGHDVAGEMQDTAIKIDALFSDIVKK